MERQNYSGRIDVPDFIEPYIDGDEIGFLVNISMLYEEIDIDYVSILSTLYEPYIATRIINYLHSKMFNKPTINTKTLYNMPHLFKEIEYRFIYTCV